MMIVSVKGRVGHAGALFGFACKALGLYACDCDAEAKGEVITAAATAAKFGAML